MERQNTYMYLARAPNLEGRTQGGRTDQRAVRSLCEAVPQGYPDGFWHFWHPVDEGIWKNTRLHSPTHYAGVRPSPSPCVR
jgi:hypothetical protein